MSARTRIVIAGGIGNIVEWYDFGLYGLLAPVLASEFFPSHDRIAALLGVYGGFAVGFAMRPIGAVVLGRVGDRQGRQRVLLLSVLLMGAATLAIGLLPAYKAIGIWAPILLIMIRLFQGFSVGGEFVGSVTYLVEAADRHRRGIAGSVANIGATAGMLMGAGVAALATKYTAAFPELWRVPFLLGGALAFVGYMLRRQLPPEKIQTEQISAPGSSTQATTPVYPTQMKSGSAGNPIFSEVVAPWPAMQAFREIPHTMIVAMLFTCGYGVSNYVTMVFLPTFAHEFASVPENLALQINTAGQALALLVVPVAGWISDHWFGRRSLLALTFLLQAAITWQLFALVSSAGTRGLWIAQLLLAGLLAVVMGMAPAMLSEQFPQRYRVSGHGFVLNVGIGIFGGSAPMVAVALIRATGSRMAPAAYLIVASVVSAIAAMFLAEGVTEFRFPKAR
jgi:MHS family proline/betaine transporter-like MFS transporter